MPALTQANHPDVIQKNLSQIFAVRYGEFKSMIPAIFDVETPDQAIVTELMLGDLGGVQTFDGQIYYDESKQSYKKTVEEIEYSLGIKISKKFRRNDLYGVAKRSAAALADRFRAKKESIGANFLNNSFSTTLTADAVSLCNSTHTSDVGGSSQANAGSSSFSPASVAATRRLMIKYKTNRDNIALDFPDTLIVATGNEDAGLELISSVKQVNTANNNPNVHKGRYELIVWHNWLTDDDNWFMGTKNLMKDYFKFYQWNPVEFFYAGDIDTLTSKHAGYMSCNVSSPDWRPIFGHEVS